jgi:hypothetical protein
LGKAFDHLITRYRGSYSNTVMTTVFSVTVRTFYMLTPLTDQNSTLCCFEKCRLVPEGEAKKPTVFQFTCAARHTLS